MLDHVVSAAGCATFIPLELPAHLSSERACIEDGQRDRARRAVLWAAFWVLAVTAHPVSALAGAAVICTAGAGLRTIAGAIAAEGALPTVLRARVAALVACASTVAALDRAGAASDGTGDVRSVFFAEHEPVPIRSGVVLLTRGLVLRLDPSAIIHGAIRARRARSALHRASLKGVIHGAEALVLATVGVGSTAELIERALKRWVALRIAIGAQRRTDTAVLLTGSAVLVGIAHTVSALGTGSAVLLTGSAVLIAIADSVPALRARAAVVCAARAVLITIAEPVSALGAGATIIRARFTVLALTTPTGAALVRRLATALVGRNLPRADVIKTSAAVRALRAQAIPVGTAVVIQGADSSGALGVREGARLALLSDLVAGHHDTILRTGLCALVAEADSVSALCRTSGRRVADARQRTRLTLAGARLGAGIGVIAVGAGSLVEVEAAPLAEVLCARVAVIAGVLHMLTLTRLRVARVDGAGVFIVTGERRLHAAHLWLAGVLHAGIIARTFDGPQHLAARGRVAGVLRAGIAILAVDRLELALPRLGVAGPFRARIVVRAIHGLRHASGRVVAPVGRAGVIPLALNRRVDAPRLRVARVIGAGAVVIADDGRSRFAGAGLARAGIRACVPVITRGPVIDLHHLTGAGLRVAHVRRAGAVLAAVAGHDGALVHDTGAGVAHQGAVARITVFKWRTIGVSLARALDRVTLTDALDADVTSRAGVAVTARGVVQERALASPRVRHAQRNGTRGVIALITVDDRAGVDRAGAFLTGELAVACISVLVLLAVRVLGAGARIGIVGDTGSSLAAIAGRTTIAVVTGVGVVWLKHTALDGVARVVRTGEPVITGFAGACGADSGHAHVVVRTCVAIVTGRKVLVVTRDAHASRGVADRDLACRIMAHVRAVRVAHTWNPGVTRVRLNHPIGQEVRDHDISARIRRCVSSGDRTPIDLCFQALRRLAAEQRQATEKT